MEMQDRIIELREYYGWTQEKLSLKLDVSIHTIKSWEYGRRTPNRFIMDKLNKLFAKAGIL